MKRPWIRKLYIGLLKKKRNHQRKKETGGKPEIPRTFGPKVVAIGGGTGLSTMLRGIKAYTQNITAIVTVADDGGGSGVLRAEYGMLPPGDIRNCIIALANTEPSMVELLNYRFSEGGLKGQSFGNLFLAALNGICGSFEEAVARMNEVLAVTGKVIPVTTADVNLIAEFEDGSQIRGESKIFHHKKQHDCRITRVRLDPERPTAVPEAIEAIYNADIVLLGPGSLYTSIIPNLLVRGITEALENTDALRLYVMNIMTQDGETEGYTGGDHIRAIYAHGSENIIDAVIYNNGEINERMQEKYKSEDAEPVLVERETFKNCELFGYPLAKSGIDVARHDPQLLAKAVFSVFRKKRQRDGIYGLYDNIIAERDD